MKIVNCAAVTISFARLPSETMIWQPEFTDKTLSRKPGAVHFAMCLAS
ncbi:hypothetical protein GXD37_23250 [Escherichia coli]|nr:hypothetical protein [Escherichia coli]